MKLQDLIDKKLVQEENKNIHSMERLCMASERGTPDRWIKEYSGLQAAHSDIYKAIEQLVLDTR